MYANHMLPRAIKSYKQTNITIHDNNSPYTNAFFSIPCVGVERSE